MAEFLLLEASFHRIVCIVVSVIGLIAALRLFLSSPAPYGKFAGKHSGWYGPSVSARVAWFLMESPNLVVSAAVYVFARNSDCISPPNLLILSFFVVHYLNRSIIYPIRMPSTAKPMPIGVMLLAATFCTVNGYIQALSLLRLHVYPNPSWLYDPRFLIGATLFAGGMILNIDADNRLRAIRKSGEYKIPRGGAFQLLIAGNYAAEIVEWCGFAIASWTLAGLAFAVFTCSNLVPRALQTKNWYQEKFGNQYDGPSEALIPKVI